MGSTWEDRFDGDSLWSVVATMGNLLDDDMPKDLDPPQRESVTRLKAALELLREHKEKGLKEFYTTSMLATVANHLNNSVIPNIQNFASSPDSYGDHINSAAHHIEQVFDYVAQWPALPAGGQAQAAGRAFSEYKKEAELALEVLQEKNTELTAEIVQLNSQMSTIETQMTSVESRYTTSFQARDNDYSDAINRVEESGREAYDKAIEDDIERRKEALDELHEQSETLVSETVAQRDEAARLALAAKDSAEWLAKRAFARDFGMQARRKSAAAWLYDFLGIAVISAPLYFVLRHFLDNQDTDGTVAVSLTRLSIILGAVVLGGYLFSRGATNHRQARASKSAEIRLNTFEAFIVALTDEEQAEIRNGMAKTIYLHGRLADEEADSPNPFGRFLDRLADGTKQAKDAEPAS